MSGWLTIKSRIHKTRYAEEYSKPESIISIECLMEELELHLRHYREQERTKGYSHHREDHQFHSIPGSRVDYSWLITAPNNSPLSNWKISVKDRKQLEELISNVKPSECCEIINVFRKRLICVKSAEELVNVMRTIVEEVTTSRSSTVIINKRPTSNEETTSGSIRPMTRFLRGLKTSSHKIGPHQSVNQSEGGGGGMLFIQRKTLCNSMMSRDQFYVTQNKNHRK